MHQCGPATHTLFEFDRGSPAQRDGPNRRQVLRATRLSVQLRQHCWCQMSFALSSVPKSQVSSNKFLFEPFMRAEDLKRIPILRTVQPLSAHRDHLVHLSIVLQSIPKGYAMG